MQEGHAVLAECDATAKGSGALELQLGECVAKLLRTGKLLEATGFAKRRDYFRERLGRSAKWVYGALKLARELADRPILRKAVQRGLVPTSKALAVMNVARDEAEAAWTIAAVHLTLDALAAKVRAGGHSPGFDEYQVDAFTMRMSEDDRKAVEMALELAGHIDGYDTEDWQRLEMMCMEFLGTFGKHGQWGPIVRVTEPLDVRPALERIDDRYALPESDLPDDPKALDERARELVRRIDGRDEKLGRLLREVRDRRLYEGVGFRWFEDYCRGRLDMSGRAARNYIRLDRELEKFPQLREAYRAGAVSRTKAMEIVKVADHATIDRLIEEAAHRSWQSLNRERKEKEERQDRKHGRYHVWTPEDAAKTIREAIHCCRALYADRKGKEDHAYLDEGQALAQIARHFVHTWIDHFQRWWKSLSKERREVLLRQRGLCNVPGCSCPAGHVHHIEFRSRGGGNEVENLIALCILHHQYAVHRGHLLVVGEAGREVWWTFAATGEVWLTRGDDDERRLTEEELRAARMAPAG